LFTQWTAAAVSALPALAGLLGVLVPLLLDLVVGIIIGIISLLLVMAVGRMFKRDTPDNAAAH
jgi:purine-cytosine permease-like protein